MEQQSSESISTKFPLNFRDLSLCLLNGSSRQIYAYKCLGEEDSQQYGFLTHFGILLQCQRRWRSVTFLPLLFSCGECPCSSVICFSLPFLLCFPHLNYPIVGIGILISAMLLIRRLCLDSCLQSGLLIHPSHCPLIGHQMFHSVGGRVSNAVAADREWFP